MTADWILTVGTIVFAITTWSVLNFGYARFRELGRLDEEEGAEAAAAAATIRLPEEVAPAVAPEGGQTA